LLRVLKIKTKDSLEGNAWEESTRVMLLVSIVRRRGGGDVSTLL